ncbi:MAG: CDP-glycerol glycerophosphotransferase family protein [Lachnospiraceae bacterium]|nr:CDP-glycerol glycerophosphotransferase family protein [Lachnospiraceae bacterium]
MGTILLYIDPGTGSMLLAAILGILTTVAFAARGLLLKLKFFFQGGKAHAEEKKTAELVLFSDHRRYASTFRPVLRELEKRKVKARFLTASKDDPLLSESFSGITTEFIGEGNLAWARLNKLQAKVVLSTTPGLSVYQWRRSKGVKTYVHILHAVGSALGYRMFGLDFYDAVLTGGPVHEKEIRELEELRGLPKKELRSVGCPYLDELKTRYDEVKKKEPQRKTEGNVTVLLAPSWGGSALLSLYGGRLIRTLQETGFDLIIRPHPQSLITEKEIVEPLMKEFPESERLAWDLSDDNFPALLKADLMVTDFSGVIFDFCLVFDKPILYAEDVFDPAPYDAAWVDHPLWKYEILPKLGIPLKEDDLGRMKELINTALHEERYALGRKEARESVWSNPGLGAKGTAKALVDFLRQEG